jgi:hypothetical protein
MRGHLTHPRKSNSGMSEIQWFELRPGRRNPAGVLRFTAHGLGPDQESASRNAKAWIQQAGQLSRAMAAVLPSRGRSLAG